MYEEKIKVPSPPPPPPESACASLCDDLGIHTLVVGLEKLIIDCISVLAVYSDVQWLNFKLFNFTVQGYVVRCTAYAFILRNWDLCQNVNDVDRVRIRRIHGSLYAYIFLRLECPNYSKRRCALYGGICNIQFHTLKNDCSEDPQTYRYSI